MIRLIVPPLVPLIVIACAAEFAVAIGWIEPFLLPRPTRVLTSMIANAPEIARALGETSLASVIGFAISTILGIAIAVVLATGGWVQRAFYPYAVFFQTVPIIAIAPLLVIWFGYDITAVIASATVVSIFPVIANTLTGLLSTDPALRDMFQLYGASRSATLIKLRLPFAMPSILTGLRIAAGLSVIGAIVGEFITGGGLGGLIDVSRQQRNIEKVFATLLVASLLGIALFAMINTLSYLLLRHWHASEKKD
jgi:NitT/TauT family transport system permease protein